MTHHGSLTLLEINKLFLLQLLFVFSSFLLLKLGNPTDLDHLEEYLDDVHDKLCTTGRSSKAKTPRTLDSLAPLVCRFISKIPVYFRGK